MNKFSHVSRMTLAVAAIVAGSALCAIAVKAQSPPPQGAAPQQGQPQQPPQQQILTVNDPRNIFHLTADQQKQEMAINQTFMNGLRALQSNSALSSSDKRNKAEQLHQSALKNFLACLTPAQKTEFLTRQAQQEKYMQGSQAAAQKMLALDQKFKASMTPAETKKITDLRQAAMAQMQSVDRQGSLSDAQKQQQKQADSQAYVANLRKILTPAQNQYLSDIARYQSEALSLQRLAQEAGP
jgi:hypothetical protein